MHNLGLVNKDDYIWYFVSTPVPSASYCDELDRCILYCILFVFICVATEFSVNKDFKKHLNDQKIVIRHSLSVIFAKFFG